MHESMNWQKLMAIFASPANVPRRYVSARRKVSQATAAPAHTPRTPSKQPKAKTETGVVGYSHALWAADRQPQLPGAFLSIAMPGNTRVRAFPGIAMGISLSNLVYRYERLQRALMVVAVAQAGIVIERQERSIKGRFGCIRFGNPHNSPMNRLLFPAA
jgi:hypothetical protein